MPVVGVGGIVTTIAAGGSHTVVQLAGGTVQAWGDNLVGQLGNDNTRITSYNVCYTKLLRSTPKSMVGIP